MGPQTTSTTKILGLYAPPLYIKYLIFASTTFVQYVQHIHPFIMLFTFIVYHNWKVVIVIQYKNSELFELFNIGQWMTIGQELCICSFPCRFWGGSAPLLLRPLIINYFLRVVDIPVFTGGEE